MYLTCNPKLGWTGFYVYTCKWGFLISCYRGLGKRDGGSSNKIISTGSSSGQCLDNISVVCVNLFLIFDIV